MGFSTKIISTNRQFFRCLGWSDSQWSNQNTVYETTCYQFFGAVIPKDFPAAHRREMAGHRELSWFRAFFFWHWPTFAGATSLQPVGQTRQRSVRTCQTQGLLPHFHLHLSLGNSKLKNHVFLHGWYQIPNFRGESTSRLWLWRAKWVCRGETEGIGAGVDGTWKPCLWTGFDDWNTMETRYIKHNNRS